MKKIVSLVAALMVVVSAGSVFASTVTGAETVEYSRELSEYLTANGIDPAIAAGPVSELPDETRAAIMHIKTTDSDALNLMITRTLNRYFTGVGSVTLRIGHLVWRMSDGL